MYQKLSILLVLFLTALFTGSVVIAQPDAPAPPPNIIVILTDDQDQASLQYMPNVQSLLKAQGVTFENYLANVPLCCPARISILRGQYVHNHEVYTNFAPEGGFKAFYRSDLGDSTVATWLQEAGYRTMFLGKYLNGYPRRNDPTYIPPGWSKWFGIAGDVKAYDNYKYKLNKNGVIKKYGNDPQDYLTDVLSRRAVRLIRRSAEKAKPFFMYLAPVAPHAPATPAPRHEALFEGYQAPRVPSFNEADVSDKPAYIQNLPLLTEDEIEDIDHLYRERLRSLQAVDEMVAALITELQATGQLDNTYILFVSDHGYHLGQHRLGLGKLTPYEEDIRGSLIIRGPGLPQNVTLPHLAGNTDLAPTIASLANAATPSFVDGRSLLPLPSQENWRDGFVIQLSNNSEETTEEGDYLMNIPDYTALRTTQYTYVEYVTGERELYDLVADPYQLTNIITTASPSLVETLSQHLAALSTCTGESCRLLEQQILVE